MKEQNGFISERRQSSNDEQPGLLSFGNYDLVRRIDVGGMGEVYLAHQRTAFGREVAVKIIRPDLVNDAVARQRFLREAEVGSYLKHDHILPLLEFGEEQGRLFIVTPYIAGGTLAQRIGRGPLSLVEVRDIFGALVRAVSYLHKRGIVHRDLKPGNILLDKEEDSERVYVRLIDFGIAIAQGLPPNAALTATDGAPGTAAYMAPERRRGIAAPSNDIYSLGVILFLMLTGGLPEHAEDFHALPAPLSDVVAHCLAPDPVQRFTSADELLRAFEHACRSLSTMQPLTSTFERPAERPRTPEPGRPVRDLAMARSTIEDAPASPAASPAHPEQPRLASQASQTGRQSNPTRPPLTARSVAQAQEQVVISPLERLNQRRSSGEHILPESENTDSGSPEREYVVLDRRNSVNPHPFASVQLPPQAGTVLPSSSANRKFRRDDYDAPTSMIDLDGAETAEELAKAQPQKRTLRRSAPFSGMKAVNGAAGGVLTPVAADTLGARPRRSSLGLLVAIASALILVALIGGGYLVWSSSITATITVGPRMLPVSEVLTMTASPNVKGINASQDTLPASALTVTQKGSLQGAPTGVSGCVLGIFDCKQTVSLNDVSYLSAQLRPGLRNTIAQNINKQVGTQGVTTIGNIIYSDSDVESAPPLGTVSRSMTVTLTEQGSIEYIRAADVHTLALQLLKQKTPAQYSLINTMTRVGQPVIRSVGANGDVKIAIAVGGVASYQLTQDQLAVIQKHLEGMSAIDARAYLKNLPNLDPSVVSVRLSYGSSIPGNIQQIKITQLQPTNIPTVHLLAVSN